MMAEGPEGVARALAEAGNDPEFFLFFQRIMGLMQQSGVPTTAPR